MIQLYHLILYQPIFNLLVFFYNLVPGHDLGLAIILVTILIKLILYPLAVSSIKSQKAMQDLQPKLSALKEKYKGNKAELNKAMMELYRQEKINPFSSCLPLLIQLPFLIAVYQVFRSGLSSSNLDLLYPFVHRPETLSAISLGVFNLAQPVILFAILAGAFQFWQAKMLMTKQPPKEIAKEKGVKDESMTAMMNKQMLYLAPLFTVIIGWRLPGGLCLYWAVMTLLTVAQQYYLFRKKNETSKL